MRHCAFYCVADSRYFVGVVALLNSLRLVGQQESVVVLDHGLKPSQRAFLEGEATVLTPSSPREARLAKTDAPLQLPATETIVLIDADVVVLRPLEAIIEATRRGQVVAFADDQPTRFCPEWRSVLGVKELTPHRYVNAGFLALPGELAPALLERVSEVQDQVGLGRFSGLGEGSHSDPFRFPDQDAWNAVLAANVPPARMTVLDHALAPFQPWEPATLDDANALRCRVADGRRPYLLHHIDYKPWLKPMPRSAYGTLLRRLVYGEDVALRIDPAEMPYWLRSGPLLGTRAWLAAKAGGIRVAVEGSRRDR